MWWTWTITATLNLEDGAEDLVLEYQNFAYQYVMIED